MADESQQSSEDQGTAVNPAALSLAFGAASQNDRVAAKVEAFLVQQTEVLRLQQEQMEEEGSLHRWSLRIRHFSDVMKVAFELSLAFIFVAIAVGIGAAIWSAANDKGVAIESFSVPPDMASRGLTGEVIAAKLLDRLSSLQSQTISSRAPSSYTNNWGSDIKVQIPDTGVSIGEFYRYLRNWLGHETRISGEVYRTDDGIAVTARAGSDTSPTYTGKEADLDKLIQQAAESVYKSTQPYRYAVYLDAHGREKEAVAIYQHLIAAGELDDRAWAYIGLSTVESGHARYDAGIEDLKRAIAIKPNLFLAYEDIANDEGSLQHDEGQFLAVRKAVDIADHEGDPSMDPAVFPARVLGDRTTLAGALGDYMSIQTFDHEVLARPDASSWEGARANDIVACASMHDVACADDLRRALTPSNDPNVQVNRAVVLQTSDLILERWRNAAAWTPRIFAVLGKFGALGEFFVTRAENPLLALSKANLGDFAAAHKLIDTTPPDCAVCLRIRGQIDALQRNWNGAEYWFRRGATVAPSIPFPDTDWGQMLLTKHDPGNAIVKFSRAHAIGPRFADPLEMWGEALVLQNHSREALAKFAEADKYAPHWGRLHLKWGEALRYVGRNADAKVQFALAAQYEMTPAEKTEMARQLAVNRD